MNQEQSKSIQTTRIGPNQNNKSRTLFLRNLTDFIQRCQDLSTACEIEFKAFPGWCRRKIFNDESDKPPTNFRYDFTTNIQSQTLFRVLFCSDLGGFVRSMPRPIKRISGDHFVVSPNLECSNCE